MKKIIYKKMEKKIYVTYIRQFKFFYHSFTYFSLQILKKIKYQVNIIIMFISSKYIIMFDNIKYKHNV